MKILTGHLRGRPIRFRPSQDLRPTSDKVRKAVFDMLQGHVEGRRVLDLFSGTGAMGFEALSSEAASAVFVENNKVRAKQISEDILRFGWKEKARVICADVLRALSRLSEKDQKFDLVFMDPPYGNESGLLALEKIGSSFLLAEGAFVIFECGRSKTFLKNAGTLQAFKVKNYGDTNIILYRRTTR